MGSHVNHRNTSTPVTVPSQVGRVTASGNASGLWPARPGRPSGSASKPFKPTNMSNRQTVPLAVVVPDFVSKPQDYLPSKYGYQEVHALYDNTFDMYAINCKNNYYEFFAFQ
jgi:hypothetical protein